MDESKKISIVMPVYNSEKYLYEAINSIQRQTYLNWELIVVDDCSTDNSREILHKLAIADKRIRPFFLDKNSGAATARNAGIHMADGAYLAFLDSDDIWLEDKLQIQMSVMKENGYAFTFTSYGLIDENGRMLNRKVEVPHSITYKQALTQTVIWTSTVMLDLKQVGTFQMPPLRAAQDTATWLQILKKVPCAYGINQILSMYRQVPTSISHSLRRRLKRQWDVYRKVEHYSLLKSTYLYFFYVGYVLRKRKKTARVTNELVIGDERP